MSVGGWHGWLRTAIVTVAVSNYSCSLQDCACVCACVGVEPVLGQLVRRPASLDKSLIDELMKCHRPTHDDFSVITATTMCALDFYEGTTNHQHGRGYRGRIWEYEAPPRQPQLPPVVFVLT